MIDTTFTSFIKELHFLYQIEKEEKQQNQITAEKKFCLFCDELKNVYQKEQQNYYSKYITPFIKKYSFLNEKSSLQIIKKQSNETYHSLFLKHLWDWRNSDYAAKALSDFILSLENFPNKEQLSSSILSRCYEIKEEHVILKAAKRSLNKKRIDLLITDFLNKWCIVLENKINSSVSTDTKRNRTQLDCYQQYCDDKKGFKDFSRIYILLSHKDNEGFCNQPWKYADYYQVFRSLFPYYTKDEIVRDYLKSLFSLLFPNEQINDYAKISLYNALLFYKRIFKTLLQ